MEIDLSILIPILTDPKPNFSVSEWISNFLEDQHPYYHSTDEDEFSGPLPADEFYDDIDESIVESLIIIALAGALAFLVYYRNQRQTNHRRDVEREEHQRQQQQPPPPPPQVEAGDQPRRRQLGLEGQQADGGFFPPPGDPGYAQWVAGGAGH